jgi:hypothetical protein
MKIAKKKLLKKFKIEQKIAMIKDIRCPLCSERVDKKEFRNKVFKREFEITGLCQSCLDMVFGYNVAW